MAMGSGPSADQLKQQAVTSRMMSLYGGTNQRVSKGRAPPRPGGPIQAERVAPSKAGDVAQTIQNVGAIAGTAAGMLHPLLGMGVGSGSGLVAKGVGEQIAKDEAKDARAVARRNRRTAGEQALERQRYEQAMSDRETRGGQAAPGNYLPAPPVGPDAVEPGAIEPQQSSLLR